MNKKTRNRKKSSKLRDSPLRNWFAMHKEAAQSAFHRLNLAPMTSLLTFLVVGISLSLPTAFQVLVNNLENGQQSINKQSRISLYLAVNSPETEIKNLLANLNAYGSITKTRYISASQGLADFQEQNMLGNALSSLESNPLPAMIQVFPDTRKLDLKQIEDLSHKLAKYELVDSAHVDMLWLERLFSITRFVKRITLAISLFLIFAVLIIIGNTIRLLGQDFHEEISVSKLVGATDAYVRRPFLYSGLIYGGLGSIFALCFVFFGLLWVTPQVEALGELYQTQVSLAGLSFIDAISILVTGMILGLGGGWVAANRLIHSLSI